MLRFRKSLMVILIEMISWGFAILLIWYWTCPESSSLIYPLLTLLSFQNQMWRWIYGGLERCFPSPLLYFIPYVCKIKTFVELQLHPLSLFLYFQNISAIKHFPFLNPPPAQKRFTSSVHRTLLLQFTACRHFTFFRKIFKNKVPFSCPVHTIVPLRIENTINLSSQHFAPMPDLSALSSSGRVPAHTAVAKSTARSLTVDADSFLRLHCAVPFNLWTTSSSHEWSIRVKITNCIWMPLWIRLQSSGSRPFSIVEAAVNLDSTGLKAICR